MMERSRADPLGTRHFRYFLHKKQVFLLLLILNHTNIPHIIVHTIGSIVIFYIGVSSEETRKAVPPQNNR